MIIFFITLYSAKIYAIETFCEDNLNISRQTQSCSFRFAISTDLFAWYPSEEVSSIWADLISIGINSSSWKAPGFNLKWDYGFRIETGFDFGDKWDSSLCWTWFKSDATHEIPFQQNTTISPEFFAAFLSGDTPQSMRASWTLLINMFDWELGRRYWTAKCISLRPFLGIKGGCINQSIHIKYYNLTIAHLLTDYLGKEHLKNDFWGIGPLGGINTKWKVLSFKNHFFDFFGDFSMATLWGNWICKDLYKNTAFRSSSVKLKNSQLGSLMFRGFMGIGWNFQNKNLQLAINVGYEMQLWINQLRLATFQLQRLHDDLTLQGVTFNCKFDF